MLIYKCERENVDVAPFLESEGNQFEKDTFNEDVNYNGMI